MESNRRVREEVERLEHKRRQRDVLVDEHSLCEFFDARVPSGVNTAEGFADWLDTLDEAGLQALHLGHEVLLREGAGQAPVELYPDTLEAGEQQFPLAYRFEPGHPEDGVTVTLPLESLNLLEARRAQWLVPGLLRDKLVALRTLPKPLRRALTPLPHFADAAMARLQGPGSGPLLEALAAVLGELTGAEFTAGEFSEELIPEHLRLRVEVLGDEGELLAAGRDVEALQTRFGRRARRRFMDRQGADFNRDGLVDWDFEALPESLTTQAGGRHGVASLAGPGRHRGAAPVRHAAGGVRCPRGGRVAVAGPADEGQACLDAQAPRPGGRRAAGLDTDRGPGRAARRPGVAQPERSGRRGCGGRSGPGSVRAAFSQRAFQAGARIPAAGRAAVGHPAQDR